MPVFSNDVLAVCKIERTASNRVNHREIPMQLLHKKSQALCYHKKTGTSYANNTYTFLWFTLLFAITNRSQLTKATGMSKCMVSDTTNKQMSVRESKISKEAANTYMAFHKTPMAG
jgi:hypothetical protein